MLRPYDIVTINDDAGCEEIRGARGYIISAVDDGNDDIGVFLYSVERVWCVAKRDVTATGALDDAARHSRGSPIRVNSKGEILG